MDYFSSKIISMSESDVSKHLKRTYKIWKKSGISWKEKIIEIIVEILIIVFAVSLSLYLEKWREKQHDRQIEKRFLTGLKYDLQSDIKEMSGDANFYAKEAAGFIYFYSTNNYSIDSIREYFPPLHDFTQLTPNTNRYEALKSSGKLDVIENAALLDSIVNLYQDEIPGLIEIFIKPFNEFKFHQLVPFLDNHVIIDKSGHNNYEEVLKMPTARNYLQRWDYPETVSSRYHKVINVCENIIRLIDEELK
jgi:hypothetical protein